MAAQHVTGVERRVVRRVSPASAFKVAAIFGGAVIAILVVATVLLWIVGSGAGAITSIEEFFQGLGLVGFGFRPLPMLAAFIGLAMVIEVAAIGASVLAAVLYNLVADVTGGIEVLVDTPDR